MSLRARIERLKRLADSPPGRDHLRARDLTDDEPAAVIAAGCGLRPADVEAFGDENLVAVARWEGGAG
jgi:hypothetical protein